MLSEASRQVSGLCACRPGQMQLFYNYVDCISHIDFSNSMIVTRRLNCHVFVCAVLVGE
jgi:hypothetical protein